MLDSSSKIQDVVDELNRRGMKLFHACQFLDFVSYLRVGGVPSRQRLESAKLPFTPFDSDDADKKNGVWNLVFFNLQDFGRTFHKSGRAVPSPYGPILLKFKPDVLSVFDSIAVCLRSAGATNFDRRVESIISLEEFRSIFVEDQGTDRQRWIKGKQDLLKLDWVKSRKIPVTSAPEISCSTVSQGDVAPFSSFLECIEVDPIPFQGTSLKAEVESVTLESGVSAPVRERFTEQQDLFDAVLSDVATQNHDLTKFVNKNDLDPDVKSAAIKWLNGGISYQYSRFARYLFVGTLTELSLRKTRKASQ